jgi:RNA polymerase sigma-70 factor (ECF subfamily)
VEELLKRAIKGDSSAYEEIVNSVLNDLYHIAKAKLTEEDDINDAIQETLFKLYKNLNKLRNPKYIKTWAIKVLINECNNIYKTKYKKTSVIEKLEKRIALEQNVLKSKEDLSSSNLLLNLSQDEKLVIILYYNSDYTTQEISMILKMKESTVKSHLHRAREKLYKENIEGRHLSGTR